MIDVGNPINWAHPCNVGLTGRWQCLPGRTGGAKWADLAKRNDLVISGVSPPYGLIPAGTGRRFGYGSFATDGINDAASTTAIPAFAGATNVTIACWVFRGSTGARAGFGRGSGPGTGGFGRCNVEWYTDQQIYFVAEGSGANATYAWVGDAGTGWRHLALAYNGNNGTNATRLAGYVNGVAQTLSFGGNAVPSALGTASSEQFGAGKPSSDAFTGGQFDDLRLWLGRTLGADEIRRVYLESQLPHDPTLNLMRTRKYFGGTSVAAPGGSTQPPRTMHQFRMRGAA